MAERPPRDLDWVPDDSTGITVPSQTKQNAGWLVEKPARQFFNWLANRQSRWTHYFSGQSQEWIIIDSTNANEKDYDTLAAYIADSPAAGDKVLVKENQTITAQMVIPSDITFKFLDGSRLLCATNIATSILKLNSNIIIEGILNIVLSQAGITVKAVEFDGDNVVGKINVVNSSTGTLTTAYYINVSKTGNRVSGFIANTGGGTLTNITIDNSTEDSNLLDIVDEPNNRIARSLGSNTFFSGFKFLFGSDADGDMYFRNAGILKRFAKGTNEDFLSLKAGIPSWQKFPSFRVNRNSVVQSINSGVFTKIQFTTEEYDSNNNFDNSINYRFTPTEAGKYALTLSVAVNSVANGKKIRANIYKNGVSIASQQVWNASGGAISVSATVATINIANGSSDHFEAYVFHDSGTSEDLIGTPGDTNFSGSRIS